MASYGATRKRPIYYRVFREFPTSLRVDNVVIVHRFQLAFLFSLEHQMWFAMHETLCTSGGRWRHRIRKFLSIIVKNATNCQ